MKIAVVSAFCAGSHKAHAINVVKMTEGFAKNGHTVVLISRTFDKPGMTDEMLTEIYGISKKFRWIKLPVFTSGNLLFSLLALYHIIMFNPDFVYARSYSCPYIFSKMGFIIAGESHAHPDNNLYWFKKYIAATHHPNFRVWITINEYLKKQYLLRGASDKFLILPDAVDPYLFKRPGILPPSPFQSNNKKITYCGHLYDYKGIPTILEVAALLPDMEFHFVGGFPEDIQKQKKRILKMGLTNVFLHGYQQHTNVPLYLWYSDILLLPPSAHHPSAEWTSPVKAGEYLLSGTPVIATAIPALKRWFTDDDVEFVEPDSPEQMADAIKKIVSDEKRRSELIHNGIKWAENNTYEKRADRIINFVRES